MTFQWIEITHLPPVKLTNNEKTMLDLFRLVPESQQKVLIQMIRGGLSMKE